MTSELNLAAARNSLWNALDVWPATMAAFATTLRWNRDISLVDDDFLSISDFPLLSIEPMSIQPVWWTHQMMQFPFLCRVQLWTANWAFPKPEGLIGDVWDAFWLATKASQSVTIVKQATGYYPSRLGPISFTQTAKKDGSAKAILTEMYVTLKRQKDPFQAS